MTQEASSQVLIDLPVALAWEKLRDISLAHNYVPGIVKTEIVSEKTEGIGASRLVYRNKRKFIQETVEEWDEGCGFLIRLHRGQKPAPPFRNAWFRYRLDDEGPDRTRLSVSLTFELPWGAAGAWLEKRMVKFVTAAITDAAMSMKLYYETGVPTTASMLRAYKDSL